MGSKTKTSHCILKLALMVCKIGQVGEISWVAFGRKIDFTAHESIVAFSSRFTCMRERWFWMSER
jgi:hypothetical protein